MSALLIGPHHLCAGMGSQMMVDVPSTNNRLLCEERAEKTRKLTRATQCAHCMKEFIDWSPINLEGGWHLGRASDIQEIRYLPFTNIQARLRKFLLGCPFSDFHSVLLFWKDTHMHFFPNSTMSHTCPPSYEGRGPHRRSGTVTTYSHRNL